jgi:hypothetical protein
MPYAGRGNRRFIIMGFNYERGPGEAVHAFGHRVESIMEARWRRAQGGENLWERFARYDLTHPSRAEVGVVHFAPNSVKDYDLRSAKVVRSACDDWLAFPTLAGQFKDVSCSEWGCHADLHIKWWHKHVPHVPGFTSGVSNNWWEYMVDPDVI